MIETTLIVKFTEERLSIILMKWLVLCKFQLMAGNYKKNIEPISDYRRKIEQGIDRKLSLKPKIIK